MAKKNRLSAYLLQFVLIVSVIFSGCGISASAEALQPAITKGDFAAEGYQPREGIETILIMGVDDYGRDMLTEGYINGMQSDFLLLVVIDESNQKVEALHLNRDTMTKINRLGVFGDPVGGYIGQLALAHAYGSGGSDSNLNAVRAVSNLLGGIKIDHYLTFTMESVIMVNDAVGGVTVMVEDDLTGADSAFVQGQEINLMGDLALKFVQSRINVADGTNMNRMARQRQYLSGLFEKAVTAMTADEEFASKLILKLGDQFTTDYSVYQMEDLADTVAKCSIEPFVTIEGENVVGKFMEFYPDSDSLHDVVRDLFYVPVDAQ